MDAEAMIDRRSSVEVEPVTTPENIKLSKGLGLNDKKEVARIMEVEEKDVARVLGIEGEDAVIKGDNYLSNVTRLRILVLLKNGRTMDRAFIYKGLPLQEGRAEFVKASGVFHYETKMYTMVLKEIKHLMEEFKDTDEELCPQLVRHNDNEFMLFPDLTALGYCNVKRQKCLDLDHSLVVLRTLGRLHGMGKVLETRGVFNSKDFKPYKMVLDKDFVNLFTYNGLQTMNKAMLQCWGPEWKDISDRIKYPLEELDKRYAEMGQLDESRFNVFNHGDPWSSNMLFKYDSEQRPISMKFIDFQLSHYNSPCWDLTYAIFSTIDPKLRHDRFNLFLNSYLQSLHATLDKYHYSGRRITFQELSAEMERIAFFRLYVATVLHAIMTADSTEALDIDELMKSGGFIGHNFDIYTAKDFKQRVGPELLEMCKKEII